MATQRRFVAGVALAGLMALSACATAPARPTLGGTPFQPATQDRFGWQEQQLQPGRWRLTFQGNARATRTDVDNALLLRAAQLTIAQGGSWFSLADQATDEQRVRQVIPDPFGASAWSAGPIWHPRYGWVFVRDPFYDPFQRFGGPYRGDELIDISRFRATAVLQIGTGAKPDGQEAWSAADVVANLGPLVRSPAS